MYGRRMLAAKNIIILRTFSIVRHCVSRLTYFAVTDGAQKLPHIMEQGAHNSLWVLPGSGKQESLRIIVNSAGGDFQESG